MIDFLQKDELDRLVSHAAMLSPKMGALCGLMGYAGLRISEALSLRIEEVYQNGTIVKSLQLGSHTGKKPRTRFIPVAPALANVLLAYLSKKPGRTDPDAYLFMGYKGMRLRPRTVQAQIHKIGMNLFNKRLHPHALRHTFATILNKQAPIRVVQEALGHASITSTQIYTHVTKQAVTEAVENAFKPQQDQPPPLKYPQGKE
jgi:integrase/recombinase XerC